MSIYKIITIDESTSIFVWKIEETYDALFEGISLNERSLNRLNGMKSENHQRGFLSIRHLLQFAGYSDFDLFYDEGGKPHLLDGKQISITHSHQFSAIIIGNQNVGIDIELQREKIVRIADKFIEHEFSYLDATANDYIEKLTVIWGAKEAKYKMCNSRSLSFKDDMKVYDFELSDNTGMATVKQNDFEKEFQFFFKEMEGFTLVYALEK
jgi:4'-phosphopantetheinyl transferase